MDGKLGFSVRFFACLVFAGMLLSCSSVTLYSVDLRYKPSKPVEARKGGETPVLLVAAFADARKIDDSLFVGAVVQDDGSRIPVVPKYARPAAAVTAMVKDYLSRSGYTVLAQGQTAQGKQETQSKKLGEVVVGGEINELEVLCRHSLPLKKYTAKVKLTVVLSDAKTGTVFYKISAESNSSLEHYRFSEEMLAEQINDALSDAVEKLFEGDEMRRKILEAAGRAS